MDRYAGRPFLRLLECFVLDAIGQLDDRQRDTLRQIEPKLRETYGREGTWARIIAGEMDFPEALSSEIRTVWGKNLAIARKQGLQVDPNEFAMAFVDQNFGALGQK
jgi:hypothetical protein